MNVLEIDIRHLSHIYHDLYQFTSNINLSALCDTR